MNIITQIRDLSDDLHALISQYGTNYNFDVADKLKQLFFLTDEFKLDKETCKICDFYEGCEHEFMHTDKACKHVNKITYSNDIITNAIFCPDCKCFLNTDGTVFMRANK